MHHVSLFTQDELAHLNSATKYPSILTYHALGEKGRLTKDRNVVFDPYRDVFITEKIDGANARIILPPPGSGDPVIGSREELLHYVGDLIQNPSQSIVETVLPVILASDAPYFPLQEFQHSGEVFVIYGEVYGGKVTSNSKQYTDQRSLGFRVFDIARIPTEVLTWPRDKIAAWRDAGGQQFLNCSDLHSFASQAGLMTVPELYSNSLRDAPPESVAATQAWLADLVSAGSQARLDSGGKGHAEGVVVRNHDRSKIAKVRVEDYERTHRLAESDARKHAAQPDVAFGGRRS